MITFVLVDRANYGRLKPVMAACLRAGLPVNAICGGSMVLSRFENPAKLVAEDGFTVARQVFCEIEGGTLLTMALSTGEACKGYATALSELEPSLVVIIGDRYEALGAATAAHTLDIPILHLQGGEVSGTLDNAARNAITALATWHWPATEQAANRLTCMLNKWQWPPEILGTGCPSTDLLAGLDNTPSDYILAAYHPDTLNLRDAAQEAEQMLQALEGRKTLLMWPNIDAGSYGIGKVWHKYRKASWIQRIVNLPPEEYYRTMAKAKCLVGNSSSFVRDSAILGVPAVIVGSRQEGRESGANVNWVAANAEQIRAAVDSQPDRYRADFRFGDGKVSERIAGAIGKLCGKWTPPKLVLCGNMVRLASEFQP